MNLEPANLFSLAEAASLLPGKLHVSTLHRWRLRGVRGIKLKTVMIGGRRFVAKSALEEFIAATTAAKEKEPSMSATASSKRTKDIQHAARSLAQQGFDLLADFNTTAGKETS
jgi:hypothetical protein